MTYVQMYVHMKSIACGHCVKGIKGKPVSVSKLEKYVNLWARENNVKYVYDIASSNKIKVAVIGSGPAGIECRSWTC